jgi:predicted anti-sigma-YlaC factor YlaD
VRRAAARRRAGRGGRNFGASVGDYLTMRCDEIRAALSARLDNEDEGVPPGAAAAHLADCADCRAWLTGGEYVTRMLRASQAELPVDRTDAIVAAVAADQAGRQCRPASTMAAEDPARQRMLRVGVAGFAVAQLVLAVPALLAGLGMEPSTHLDHEFGAFDATIATVFLLAAWRPALARAYVPVAFALAALLLTTSVLDIVRGVVPIGHETTHVVVLVQAVLLWRLARAQQRPPAPRLA